jgi:glycosyltransferase involved in cell wall biosynthesis
VLLVVKSSRTVAGAPVPAGRVAPGTTSRRLAELLGRHPGHAPVRLIDGPLSDASLRGLHARGDCYLALSRGEGWGFGAFDAAAHGKPAVVTGLGGWMDYLAGSPTLVDHRLVAVGEVPGAPSYGPGQRWAEPDVDHAATLLREVAGGGHRDWARDTAPVLRQRYRPEAVAAALLAVVERHRVAR